MSNSSQSTALIQAPKPALPAVVTQRGITPEQWSVLTKQLFPSAKSESSVLLAWDYCKARGLDPLKKPVHIVPFYNSDKREWDEQVLPGINELLITASRTGLFAGKDPAVFGPTRTFTFKSSDGKDAVSLEAPEWCTVTVYKFVDGQKCAFTSDEIYFTECVALAKGLPNKIWKQRTRGQMGKCALAAALRVAFPEEVGSEQAAEEVEGKTISFDVDDSHPVREIKHIAAEIASANDHQVASTEDSIDAAIIHAESSGREGVVEDLKTTAQNLKDLAEKITRAEGIQLNKFAGQHGWSTEKLVQHLVEKYDVRPKHWTDDLTKGQLAETKAFIAG